MNIRVVDERGWIGQVHITANEMTVAAEGNELESAELEFFSPAIRQTIRLHAARTVTFPPRGGLPSSNVWLWLKRDSSWLDYRSLAAPWISDELLDQANVQIDRPLEPQAIVEALIYAGEGPRVEFKRETPDQQTKSRNPFKTVAAFANGDGDSYVAKTRKEGTSALRAAHSPPLNAHTHGGPSDRLRVRVVQIVRLGRLAAGCSRPESRN